MEIYPVEAYAQTAIDISIDEASLGKIDSEVKIIHGRGDQAVDLRNPSKLCKASPRCEFEKVEDVGNSFSSFEGKIVQVTVEF